jgi:hypothetical protein
VKPGNARGDHARDLRHRQVGGGRQQPAPARMHPLAHFVELSDHARSDVFLPVVQVLLELVLDDLALLFHHEDLVESVGELADRIGLERPRHRDLEHPQADRRSLPGVDAQLLERLEHVTPRLAGCADAEPRRGAVVRDAIEPVRARVGDGRVDLVVLHQRFLLARLQAEHVGGQSRMHAARRRNHVFGQHDRLVDRGIDRAGRLHRVGQRLEADRQPGEARHREAVQAQLDVLADAVRVEHRDHRCGEQVIALVGQRRRVRAVIVAGHEQHAAMLRGAGMAHVLEDVAAAIHAGRLAVPQRKHAVVVAVAGEVNLLRAPDRGGRELFVDAGQEADGVGGEVLFGLPEGFVDPAERGAPVAGDEACGAQAGGLVALALGDHQANQRLDAVQVDPPGGGGVLVVERDVLHDGSIPVGVDAGRAAGVVVARVVARRPAGGRCRADADRQDNAGGAFAGDSVDRPARTAASCCADSACRKPSRACRRAQ